MNQLPTRKNTNRLAGYDYSSSGAYFITICAIRNRHLFGRIEGGNSQESNIGQIVDRCWQQIPEHFPECQLDEYVIMPNHLHGILWIQNDIDEAPYRRTTLGRIIGSFKAAVSRLVHTETRITAHSLWQRNYYEHIIRTDRALYLIRRYIVENPRRWSLDKYNSIRTGQDEMAIELWSVLDNDRCSGTL